MVHHSAEGSAVYQGATLCKGALQKNSERIASSDLFTNPAQTTDKQITGITCPNKGFSLIIVSLTWGTLQKAPMKINIKKNRKEIRTQRMPAAAANQLASLWSDEFIIAPVCAGAGKIRS